MLKVCIFGGGAIGGYIAAHLARAGQCEVSVVARGATLAALRTKGLRVHTPAGVVAARVNAVADARELGVQDYVFITLKAHQLDAALDDIAALMDEHTTVLPPTTGIPYYFFHGLSPEGHLGGAAQLSEIDPGGRQWRTLPPAQVLGCVHWIGAHVIEPGVIAQDGDKAGCPIGELDGSASERVTRLTSLLSESGIASKTSSDIRSAIWTKFVNSLCWNPVALLTQATLGEMRDAPGVVPLVRTMMQEADALAQRLGIKPGPEPERRIATTLSAPHHKMSMLQDFEAGRPLELGPLVRSLRAVARLAGSSASTLDTVLALASLRAQACVHHRNEEFAL
ncbi:ketopantoate reductase family protein [Paraburkholderia nodosa]|uniref:ketopantoate reductase family protein n=1 Tax=Paraburkholderia nodosa TaxID=392320 RepID=UPI0004AC82D1|nr:2-dehydropantoate 2-reductase [Paraburkholderia nodosa]